MKKAIDSPLRGALAAILLSILAGGARGDGASRPPASPSPRPRPAGHKLNLLLITLDTTRADHLGCYGDADAQTPRLDRLAAEGVLATRAISVGSLTLPSHASMMTSLYPPRHGVRDNADFRLPESETTLAEHLKKQGYATAAVVASFLLSSTLGLNQGFDTYDEPAFGHEPTPVAVSDGRVEAREAGGPGGARLFHRPLLRRPATEVTDAALAALNRISQRPFFLWAHYYDPHFEYSPPEPFASRLAGRPYDGAIAYMDSEVGRLLDGLKARGVLDRTLVVAMADHGENLGEHGEEGHGVFIYDGTIHVPLILRLPGVVPGSRRYTGLVSGVDLAPTCLELLAVPPLPRAQGRSFAAAIAGKTLPAREVVYAESIFPQRAFGWAPLYALRSEETKFIEAPIPEIYDVLKDPGETRNLAPDDPASLSAWRGRLAALSPALGGADPSAGRPMSDEERERLASLGYVSSGSRAPAVKSGPDPKLMMEEYHAISEATVRLAAGQVEQARLLLDRVLRTDPANPVVLSLSGTIAFSGGRRESGLAQLEKAALATPDVFPAQWNLANAYHEAGRYADAARAYRAALAIRPASGQCHYALGNVLFSMKDAPAAVREYREAVRCGFDTPPVRAALGVALAIVGDDSGAEESLRAAVDADPSLTGAWIKLGNLAEGRERLDQAKEFYERALEIEPANSQALVYHAKLSLGLGDRAAASAEIERLRRLKPDHPALPYLEGRLRLLAGDKAGAREALRSFLARSDADPRLAVSAREILAGLGD